mgnify:CR=1 FL=1
MATTLRLRKADLELLAAVDTHVTCENGESISAKQVRAWSIFYERVLTAEMRPRKTSVLSVTAAIEAFRGVLGKRLVVPAGNPGAGWYAQLQNRINSSGLTPELCRTAAEMAAVMWKGPIKAESVIRQADVLLSDAAEAAVEAPQEVPDMTEL